MKYRLYGSMSLWSMDWHDALRMMRDRHNWFSVQRAPAPETGMGEAVAITILGFVFFFRNEG